MDPSFSCLHVIENYWTNRLYFSAEQKIEEIGSVVHNQGQERRGLGLTEYSKFKDFFYIIGLAFKTTDENGNVIYLNKKSFCHLLMRLEKCNNDADSIDDAYKQKLIKKKELKEAYQIFDGIYAKNKDKNICQLATKMRSSLRVRYQQDQNVSKSAIGEHSEENVTFQQVKTNLTKERPDWLPQFTYSKAGLLSNINFLEWLKEENQSISLSDPDIITKMKWFFQQRKFTGLECGTLHLKPTDNLIFQGKKVMTQDGYASAISKHSIASTVFIEDSAIIAIEECVKFAWCDEQNIIPIGYYADGTCMIQQLAPRGCVATTAAMLITNAKQDLSFDYSLLYDENLSTNDKFIDLLKKFNLTPVSGTAMGLKKMQEAIQLYGSLSITGDFESIGGHQIILDKIDAALREVTIRDPAHGWRIKIPLDKFLKMTNNKLEYVGIKGN